MLVCLLNKFTAGLTSIYAVGFTNPALSVLVSIAVVVVLQEVEAIVAPVYPVLVHTIFIDVATFVSAAALQQGGPANAHPVSEDGGEFGVGY